MTEPRVDTGPYRFGSDWPGVFIRGDEALHYASMLRRVFPDQTQDGSLFDGLAKLLESCRVD